MVKGFGSVRYLALFCSLLVLGCATPNTSVSETPPPQVIRPENTHVLRDTSAPREDTGHLQVTPLPAPYKSWEAFYDDFFSEDESVLFQTQGLVQNANYNLPSLTANMKYGGTPWKIKDIPYRFNLPQVLKETDKTNAFFQVVELGRDDKNKLFVSKVILAISLYKRQDVSEHYEVKNWMNRHFYSEDGITFEAREPTDGEKNYTLLKASYKDLTPYEKNRDYGHSTASYADLTTCNSYYRVESATRAVNYPVNILSLSGPGAPDENGKMYATATGQVKSVFYGTASHRASFYCPVESTSDNDNSLGEISSDAYFTFNALWDPNQQISCYKTEGSTITGDKWYYDSLSEVPKIFSVNNQQCSPCQPGALRDDSMPEICRSTSPSPTPTPTPSPTPTPTPTPSPSECEDAPVVSPMDIQQLMSGIQNFLQQNQNSGFQIQAANSSKKSFVPLTESELNQKKQFFDNFLISQPLLQRSTILGMDRPDSLDTYRDQIVGLTARMQYTDTFPEWVEAAQAYSELTQTYFQLSEDIITERLSDQSLGTDWPTYASALDTVLFDAPDDVTRELARLTQDIELAAYLSQHVEQIAVQLEQDRLNLEQKFQALLAETQINPETVTASELIALETSANTVFAEADQDIAQFEQLLQGSGFQIQAAQDKSKISQALSRVKADIAALKNASSDKAQTGLSDSNQEYSSRSKYHFKIWS